VLKSVRPFIRSGKHAYKGSKKITIDLNDETHTTLVKNFMLLKFL
jgi:hypothetical protein